MAEKMIYARNELDGLRGITLGDGRLIGRGLDDGCVPQDRQRRIDLSLTAAHVVAVGNAEVAVEALLGRQERRLIAEVPLADASRGVTLGLEHFGDRDLLGIQGQGLCGMVCGR